MASIKIRQDLSVSRQGLWWRRWRRMASVKFLCRCLIFSNCLKCRRALVTPASVFGPGMRVHSQSFFHSYQVQIFRLPFPSSPSTQFPFPSLPFLPSSSPIRVLSSRPPPPLSSPGAGGVIVAFYAVHRCRLQLHEFTSIFCCVCWRCQLYLNERL